MRKTMSKLRVFVPRTRYKQDIFILGRTYLYLKKLIEARDGEMVCDSSSHIDVAHLFSVRQVLDYEAIFAERRIPYFVHAFSFYEDYEKLDSLSIDLKKETLRAYNSAAGVIVYWPAQKILLRHLGVTVPIEVVHPVGEDFNPIDPIAKDAFRHSYAIPAERRIVANFGIYHPENGFEEFEALARIMPDIDFYFFGLRTTLFNSSIHYSQAKANKNLFYEDVIPSELYPSLITSATAAVLTGTFHIESILLADILKSRVPIISNKNPVLFDMLIDRKTSLIVDSTEGFYNALHDIDIDNFADQGFEYISQYTYDSESEVLFDFYRSMI